MQPISRGPHTMTPRVAALLLFLILAACATGRPVSVLGLAHAPPPATARRLARRIAETVRPFQGRVGVAVEAVEAGWRVAYDGEAPYPQQSVSKLCTAIALLGQVDAGRLSLSDPLLVRREDMSVFHQPIQARLTDAGYRATLGELLQDAIAQSDNAADDILIRRLGGPHAVQAAIAWRGIKGVRCGPEEHVLQSRIAGLTWRPEYSFGRAFWTARDALDPALRKARLDAYLADPDDGATPLALVDLLARLKRGALLSPASTARLLAIMTATTTGPARLPAGLGPGWSIAHKTGTGQDLGDLSTGNNDVGLLTAPDGRSYAVAVMIASTRQPVAARQQLDAAVARAVVAEIAAPP